MAKTDKVEVAKLDHNFQRDDLNALVDKVNELVEVVNNL